MTKFPRDLQPSRRGAPAVETVPELPEHEASGPASSSRDPAAHVSDEELVGLVLEDLPAHVELAVSLHVDHCEECARVLELHFAAAVEYDQSSPPRSQQR